jgi:hypothetical protein
MITRSFPNKKFLAASLSIFLWVMASFLVFTSIQAADYQSGSPMWQCSRHGHNDQKWCGPFAEYFGASTGYEKYSGSYSIRGHRHGGSEIEVIVCMGVPSQGQSSCDWFHSWGDGLGEEWGCCPYYENTYKQGNFSDYGNPSGGGAVYTIKEYVKDAEVYVTASYQAIPKAEDNDDEPGPGNGHLACSNSACTWVLNTSPGQDNEDGCAQAGQACGGSSGGRNKCQGNACVFDPNDNGPDQCSTDGDCGNEGELDYRCNGSSCIHDPGNGDFEASDCNSTCTGPGEAYYQGYYQGSYPPGRNKCEGNACVFDPSDSGPNQCSTDGDCGGGELYYRCDGSSCIYDPDNGAFNASDCNGACEYGQGAYQGGYEGAYQGAYESGYYSQGGYYSQSAYYSQSYYEASYSHSTCTSDGACTIVGGKGANQCSVDYPDCPQPPPTCTLTAVPARIVIPPPQSITLTWTCGPVRPPTNCTITNVGGVGTSGSIIVRPTSSVTYALNCTNSAGTGTASIKARVFTGEPGSLKEIVPR